MLELPEDLSKYGEISVYRKWVEEICTSHKCYPKNKSEMVWIFSYNLKPEIKWVTIDMKNFISKAWAWEIITIKWENFWDSKWEIFFWDSKITDNIYYWWDNEIELKIPWRKENLNGIYVRTWNVSSDTFDFLVPKYSKWLKEDNLSQWNFFFNEHWVEYAWETLKNRWEWIVVAVIDDWMNSNHPDLKNALYKNKWEIPHNWIDDDKNWFVDDYQWWDFIQAREPSDLEYWSHWTMVSWIIAWEAWNWWIAWVAPKAKIMPLVVFSKKYKSKSGQKKYILQAINYAIDNWADIINISLWRVLTVYDEEYDILFKKADEKWVIIVVSSWNWDYTKTASARDLDVYPSSPVCNDGEDNYVIWVGSLKNNLEKSKFSDYWKNCIDISAVWEEIKSASHRAYSPDRSIFESWSWSSYSAPIISWSIALVWSNYPFMTHKEIKKALLSWGKKYKNIDRYSKKMWTILDLQWFISYAKQWWIHKIKNKDITYDGEILTAKLSKNIDREINPTLDYWSWKKRIKWETKWDILVFNLENIEKENKNESLKMKIESDLWTIYEWRITLNRIEINKEEMQKKAINAKKLIFKSYKRLSQDKKRQKINKLLFLLEEISWTLDKRRNILVENLIKELKKEQL